MCKQSDFDWLDLILESWENEYPYLPLIVEDMEVGGEEKSMGRFLFINFQLFGNFLTNF